MNTILASLDTITACLEMTQVYKNSTCDVYMGISMFLYNFTLFKCISFELYVILRIKCKKSHDLRSAHNSELLEKHDFHGLAHGELFQLLLQNDPSLLPEVNIY